MNRSPDCQSFLYENGYEAIHWSALGASHTPDSEVMPWARESRWVVFTHDLDFGILLAHSKDGGPSVMQVRTLDVSPEHLDPVVLRALRAHGEALENGALGTVDESKSRVRILPL